MTPAGAGWWMIAPIVLPLAAAVLAVLAPTAAPALGIAAVLGGTVAVAGLAREVIDTGALRYAVAGWHAPLGIDLRADGLAVAMLAMTALVALPVSLHARDSFPARGVTGRRRRSYFWPLWLFLLTGLNALFLSGDLFNLYVTLELIGFAAVVLAALGGDAPALMAAMRYLLISLFGSLCFLFGVALLYAAYGSVDMAILAATVTPGPVAWAALALMSSGLLMKGAVCPLHVWLPPAHANAPAPVSAALSALVVKAPLYILLRLWLEVFAALDRADAATLLGLLGAAAIIWGSLQALVQRRLKLLVAYSTVAQIGYVLLVFPLADPALTFAAWSGAIAFAVAHASAKAAMFLAAGNIIHAAGHDRLAGLGGIIHALPVTAATLALASVSLVGLPPSGGFIGKWQLLSAAVVAERWAWAALILAGTLLAAGYVMRVLWHAFSPASPAGALHPVPHAMQWPALALALLAALMGLIVAQPVQWLRIGAPPAIAAGGGGGAG